MTKVESPSIGPEGRLSARGNMTTVNAVVPGTPKWAEVIAIRIVAQKYASEVNAIQTELLFAYAQGYQDAGRDKVLLETQEGRQAQKAG